MFRSTSSRSKAFLSSAIRFSRSMKVRPRRSTSSSVRVWPSMRRTAWRSISWRRRSIRVRTRWARPRSTLRSSALTRAGRALPRVPPRRPRPRRNSSRSPTRAKILSAAVGDGAGSGVSGTLHLRARGELELRDEVVGGPGAGAEQAEGRLLGSEVDDDLAEVVGAIAGDEVGGGHQELLGGEDAHRGVAGAGAEALVEARREVGGLRFVVFAGALGL